MVTLYLASGLSFFGVLTDITYLGNVAKGKQLTNDEKRMRRPRMVKLTDLSTKDSTWIDAIKIDAVLIGDTALED